MFKQLKQVFRTWEQKFKQLNIKSKTIQRTLENDHSYDYNFQAYFLEYKYIILCSMRYKMGIIKAV